MQNAHDLLRKPIITEKSMAQLAEKKYTFAVPVNVNKFEIKQAVEEVFKVKVEKVWSMRVPGKLKRRGKTSGLTPEWKKAIVKLTADSKTIEFFDGMN